MDEEAPKVTILLPNDGQGLTVPDTLVVTVRVSDNVLVQNVVFTLTDENGIPQAPSVSASVEAGSAQLTRDIPVTDQRLPSGTYTLAVRAGDGTNSGSDFRSIQLTAAPLRLRSAFAVHPSSGGSFQVTRIDSVQNILPFGTFAQDLNGALADGHAQRLLFAGEVTGPLLGVDPDLGTTVWQIANTNGTGTAFFTALDPAGQGSTAHATNNGFLRRVNSSTGSITVTASLNANRIAVKTHVQDGLWVTEQRTVGSTQRHLVTYALASGAPLQQFVLDKEVVFMGRRDPQHVLLFGNRNGDGVIEDRNIDQGGYWEPRVFVGSPIGAVARQDENVWFVALPDELVRFTYASAGVVTIGTGSTYAALHYDAANGWLWGATGNMVHVMDPMNGNLVASLDTGAEVAYLLLLFNR